MKNIRWYRSVFCSVLTIVMTLLTTHSILHAQMKWSLAGPKEAVKDLQQMNGMIYLLTDKAAYTSTDGKTWTAIRKFSGSEFYYSIVALKSGEIFLFSYNSYVVTTDSGGHWKNVAQAGFSTRRVIADQLGYLFAGQNDPIKRSTDKGVTWTNSDAGTSANFFDVGVMTVDAGGTIFAGNQGITGGLVYYSTNHGDHWYLLHNEPGNDIDAIASSFSSVWIATNTKLLYSGDGTTWSSVYTFPSFAPFVSILQTGENELFGGSRLGVFYSADHGVTWDSVNTGLLGHHVSSMMLTPGGVLIGTDSGIFVMAGPNAVHEQASEASLITMSPNPAREHITITLPVHAGAIRIYDERGVEYACMIEHATSRNVVVNTSALPIGTYLVKVEGVATTSRFQIVR